MKNPKFWIVKMIWINALFSNMLLRSEWPFFQCVFITYHFLPSCRCATEAPQKGPDLSANASVSTSPSAAAEAPAEAPPVSAQSCSTSAPLEPQSSTIRSEVMPSSPMVIHHVQSSPVHMQQLQQSAALTGQPSPPLITSPTHVASPNPSKCQGRESPKGAATDPSSSAHHRKTHANSVNNGNGANQGLVIEELQNSQDKSKDRTMSIEVCLITFQLLFGYDMCSED